VFLAWIQLAGPAEGLLGSTVVLFGSEGHAEAFPGAGIAGRQVDGPQKTLAGAKAMDLPGVRSLLAPRHGPASFRAELLQALHQAS
jgi:hypothetical protein